MAKLPAWDDFVQHEDDPYLRDTPLYRPPPPGSFDWWLEKEQMIRGWWGGEDGQFEPEHPRIEDLQEALENGPPPTVFMSRYLAMRWRREVPVKRGPKHRPDYQAAMDEADRWIEAGMEVLYEVDRLTLATSQELHRESETTGQPRTGRRGLRLTWSGNTCRAANPKEYAQEIVADRMCVDPETLRREINRTRRRLSEDPR